MKFVSDRDVWPCCDADWLWIYDKLIVAQKQSILSGPAGIPVPESNYYITRPITNIRMMGRGAQKVWISAGDESTVPDGFFWSEVLEGEHISVDYHWGEPVLAVQGYRDDPDRLDRFCRWCRVDRMISLPDMLQGLEKQQEWINVEYIGGQVIEVHLRYNDDFANHCSDEIIPVWRENPTSAPLGWSWYDSPGGDRLGFWIKDKKC